LNKLSEVVKQFEELKKEYNWGTNLPYMLSGAYNLPQKDVMEWLGTNRYTVNTIVHSLLSDASDEVYNELKAEDYSNIKKLYIVGGGPKLQKSIDGLKSIIQNDEDALLYHSSSRYANGLIDVSSQSIIGLSGSEADKLIERMGVKNLSKFDYLLPASPRKMNTSLHDSIKGRAVELPFKKSSIGDSPLGMGLDLASELNINEIYLVGFDGYDFPNKVQLSLMNENQNAIDAFVRQGGQIVSLTSTTYGNVIRKSIYSKLS
jgi:4-hydroxy 2-oxovalerate aldolase